MFNLIVMKVVGIQGYPVSDEARGYGGGHAYRCLSARAYMLYSMSHMVNAVQNTLFDRITLV